MVCIAPQLFLPVYPHPNVGLTALPAPALATPIIQHCLAHQLPPRLSRSTNHHLAMSCLCPSCPSQPLLLVWMNVSSLTLVVGLPYSLIFWQFWLFFVFKFVVVLLLVVRGSKVYLPMPPSWLEVSFFFMANIPLYVCTTSALSKRLLMGTWVASIS